MGEAKANVMLHRQDNCPTCEGKKDARVRQCRECRFPKYVCECGNPAKYASTKECKLCYLRRYNAENKEAQAERMRQYALDNPHRIYGAQAKRRAKKRATVEELPSNYYGLVMEFYSECGKCGTTADLQLDHVIPLAKGGTHTMDNFGVLCGPCNRSKAAKIEPDYRLNINPKWRAFERKQTA